MIALPKINTYFRFRLSYSTCKYRRWKMNSLLKAVFLVFLYHCIQLATTGLCMESHYCPYFKNRAPSPQSNLGNCTWYKENSCCLNHELNEILSTFRTPFEATTEECRKHTNYLMCYVCAPNQETFYENERLTVCEEFCTRWYEACKDALWKGFSVSDLYTNVTEFCLARKFLVASQSDTITGCYTLEADTTSHGSMVSCNIETTTIVMILLYYLIHF